MAKFVMAVLFVSMLLSPVTARAIVAGCGDDSVPLGVWPNCEPCAGDGAAETVATILQKHGEVLDGTVNPTAYDYVAKCLAALEKVFFVNVGLPSLEDILGILCEATRQYSRQWLDKINQKISISAPYGIVSGNVGVGGKGATGGITVRDTSRQAVEAAKGCL